MIVRGRRPGGFDVVREGRLWLHVRSDVAAALVPLLRQWSTWTLPPSRPVAGGRGGAGVFDLAPGLTVVLRQCRRGGVVGRLNRDLYFGVRPRPFRELRFTEEVRTRGGPAVEVIGAGIRWTVPGCYRGVVVSREVRGAINLWEFLQAVAPIERGRVCVAAAAATRRLHDAGAVHPDLNLQNYLVRGRDEGYEVLIIDYDRVRLRRVLIGDRQAAFARVCRSIRRLDPQTAVITLACVEAFQTITRPGTD